MALNKPSQNASRSSDRNPTASVLMRFITHAMWLHLMHPIVIQRPRLNSNDSYLSISSEPLMCFIRQLRPNRL